MRIGLLGCKGTTLDLLADLLLSRDVPISHVFTLPENLARSSGVSFYQGHHITALCDSHQVPVSEVATYSLTSPADHKIFSDQEVDLLLVVGWERIIPVEILNALGKFACGMHGSAYGLPRGRGRSPLNWSLIQGHNRFITYLFRYSPGMDDGPIIGFRVFEINAYDDIASLHSKNRIAMGQIIRETYGMILDGSVSMTKQPTSPATYYPKRTEEDGEVDWTQTAEDVSRLVRAVTHPYPGAWSKIQNKRMRIHQAQPFDSALFAQVAPPGTVIDVQYSLDRIVVQAGTGTVLVSNPEPSISCLGLRSGDRFETGDLSSTLERIRLRYPNFVREDQKEI